MVNLTDQQFEEIIAAAMDALPEHFLGRADNVAVVWAEKPSEQQRTQMNLSQHQTLFGLYEGVPKTARSSGYSLVLPDKITIFKQPITEHCHTTVEVEKQVLQTLWHEIAHHYGLDHQDIDAIEQRNHNDH